MKPRLFVAIVTLALSATATAEIYKWTDANGNTHYSDKPPTRAAQVLDIKSQRTDPELIARLNAAKEEQQRDQAVIVADPRQAE